MAEELKHTEDVQEAPVNTADNDEDIDHYIRELTGREAPQKQKKEEERESEVEHFRVTSQIGEDDYKAFIYYSTLFRFKWMLPVFIIVPLVFSLIFAFNEGKFYPGNFILSLVVLYLAITLILVVRCTRWISKIKKNSPNVMHLTETTLVFLTYSVVNMKNGNHIKVGYKHMIDAGEGRRHFVMYFDNGKSMIFRKEDMPPEELEKFRTFIHSKVHKQKMFQTKK